MRRPLFIYAVLMVSLSSGDAFAQMRGTALSGPTYRFPSASSGGISGGGPVGRIASAPPVSMGVSGGPRTGRGIAGPVYGPAPVRIGRAIAGPVYGPARTGIRPVDPWRPGWSPYRWPYRRWVRPHWRSHPYNYYDDWGWGWGATGLATGIAIGAAAAMPAPVYATPAGAVGSYCATPVRTCALINAAPVGTGCSCRVTGGRARGTVTGP